MAQPWALHFYNSPAWIRCRDGFMASKYYVCERCGSLAVICHHRVHLTPETIGDPNVTLNWDNLQALCLDCHNREHGNGDVCAEGLRFDSRGNLVKDIPPRGTNQETRTETEPSVFKTSPRFAIYREGQD